MSKRTKYNQYKQLPEVNVTDLLMKIGSQCLIRMLIKEANEQEISPIKKLLEHEAPDKKYNLTYKDLQLIQHLDFKCKYLRKHMIDRLEVLGEYYNLPLVQVRVWCAHSIVPYNHILRKCVKTNNLDAFKYLFLTINPSISEAYNIVSVGKCSDCFMWVHQLYKNKVNGLFNDYRDYKSMVNIQNPTIVKKLCESFEDFKDYHLKAITRSNLNTEERINMLKKFYGNDIPDNYLIKLSKKYPGISIDHYRGLFFKPPYHDASINLYIDLIVNGGLKLTEEELLCLNDDYYLMREIATANVKKHGCTYQSRDIQNAVVAYCCSHYDYNYLCNFLDDHNAWHLLNPTILHTYFKYAQNDSKIIDLGFGNLVKRWIKSDANINADKSDVILHVLFGGNIEVKNMAKSVLQLMK
jgi:hypothetical protein